MATKYWLKRRPDILGRMDFEWRILSGSAKSAKWDWNKIEKTIEKMEPGEEKVIEI